MSSRENNKYITYNSLISLCILSEDYDNSQYAKFLYAEENLEHSLSFKLCNKTFLDYSDIKGSLFYIRNIEECMSNYGFSEKQENISKELGFFNKERVIKNTDFYLQHMTSKKFVSVEKTIDNRCVVKLMKNIDKAAHFYLRKVNEGRNSKEYMNINDAFNLSIYFEDEGLFYNIKDNLYPIKGNYNIYEINIDKNKTTTFLLIEQNWYIKETREIYSGQLINITFSLMKEGKKENYMLGLTKKEKEEKEEKEEDLINNEENSKYEDYIVSAIPFTEELNTHVLNNSFWCIEEESSCLEEMIKMPLKIKKNFRIRNLNTGLYLKIKERSSNLDNLSYDDDTEISNKLYEFYLVDELSLNQSFKLEYNFLFLHSSFGVVKSEILDNGEYLLKGVYKKLKLKDFKSYQYYYKPIALNMMIKNRLDIKQEEDFIFKIKKVDLYRGIQVTYIRKILDTLDNTINDNMIEKDHLINESIKFCFEYLMNIDYSFRDEKYESNIPIKERQILLLRFHVVELIDKVLEYYLNKIEQEKNIFLNDNKKKILSELLNNIIKFYKNLSVDNEEIKLTIYIISLNKLLKLCDLIFCDNITDIAALINFIFNLIDDSEALQDYLLGGNELIKEQIKQFKNLEIYDIEYLLREPKLLEYIEKNHNYLLYYEKLIGLNKIQYKRNEIELHVKSHIEFVKSKNIIGVKNYKQIIDQIVLDLKSKIKKHAILLDKFIKEKEEEKINPMKRKQTKRSILRKVSVKLEEENLKKELEAAQRKSKKKTTTIQKTNILITESDRVDTNNRLIESEEKVNIDNNNINNDNKQENNIIDEETNKEDSDRKNDNIKLKKSLTIRNLLKKKTNISKFSEHSKKEGDSELNRIRLEFEEKDENKNKADKKKIFSNFLGNIINRKAKILNKTKIDSFQSSTKRNSIRFENALSYNKYLEKLIAISKFIKFFSTLDLNKGLFINEYFEKLINNEYDKGGVLDNSLYIFFIGDTIEKGKYCFLDKNIVNLYLLYLYNNFFPEIKIRLNEKEKEIKGVDIIEELNLDNIDNNNYSDIDDENDYVKMMFNDFNEMDDNLCILYSIYQFLINQYTKTVYKLFNLKSNFYLNFLSTEDINNSKIIFSKMINNLLDKIAFLNKDSLENLFIKIKSNPSLLNEAFDLENYQTENNINKSMNKGGKKNKIEIFSRREGMLIEYLYFFLKKCDEIKYLYEKMVIYKYIKNIIDYERKKEEEEEYYGYEEKKKKAKKKKKKKEEKKENEINEIVKLKTLDEVLIKDEEEIDEEEENEIDIDKNLSIILHKLINQQLSILSSYEKLVNSNKKNAINNRNQKEENWNEEDKNIEEGENDKFLVFKVKEKTEFITQLLRSYEIKKFFNNIIYMVSKDSNIISDKSLKKLRRIRGYFENIEKVILDLKINNYTKNMDLLNDIEESNKKSLEILNINLKKICNAQGQLFHLDFNINRNENNKLINMLLSENKAFYKKIKFTKIFERMVKYISFFKNYKDKDILIYCSYLLKIFNDLKNKDSDFHRNITKYLNTYQKLVYRSIKCINGFAKEKIIDEEPLFLSVSYLGIEALLIILQSCKKKFLEIKDFMEIFFFELSEVFNKFENKKYKIIFQILYTYAVSRVLLFLNKERTYDAYSYDSFFNSIYPIKKMKENISFCFGTINSSLDKEHILNLRNSDIFLESENKDESEEGFSKFIQDDEKESLIMNDFADKIIPMDLSFVNKEKESINIKKKHVSNKIIKDNDKNMKDDFIRWEDENEINRISFYLNYLSVYVIYLNDKNILIQEKKNEYIKKEIQEKTAFSFDVLSRKIRLLLDTEHLYDELANKKDSDNLMITQIENSIIKEEKNFFGEDLGRPKNIDYRFFSVLLESILFYRSNLYGQKIEIQIKKVKTKNKEEKHFDENDLLIDKDELFINENDNDNLIFYYYNPEHIDIILLEKIINEVELKDDLQSYCLEDYHSDKKNSYLLNELFKDKKAYRIIQNYYDDEYNLIHNYFIKNNMELLIKNIIKSFTSNDFEKINEMENFLYKRMGEIYSNAKLGNDSLQKNNSLVDFLIMNEKNIRPDLKKINLLAFFDSLVYIYQKFRKPICILYYKIGFELLIDRCLVELKSKDKNEDEEKDDETKLDVESMTNTLILLLSSKQNRDLISNKKVFSTMVYSIKTFLLYILSKGGGRFIFKNIEFLKEFFNRLNLVFKMLSDEFEKIVNFMKKPNKTKDMNKFIRKSNKLENILDFHLIFLEFKKLNEDILTDEIFKFTGEVIEKVINLLFILLQLPNKENFIVINILIEFLFNFVSGPDIRNLNLLFSLGFYDLVCFVIRDIDYYNIFLNYLNGENLYEIIENYAIAECKIIKIFIIYYNITIGNNNNIDNFEELQHWYEDNFDLIKKKLKRLYYISKKEMEDREYNIDKMMLFYKKNDNYNVSELISREISHETNKNIYEKKINKLLNIDKSKKYEDGNITNHYINQYCIIKFDLLLAYYSLYNYHLDLSTNSNLNISKRNIFFVFILFVLRIFTLIFRMITIVIYAIYFIVMKLSIKKKTNIDLLQDLRGIDKESQYIDEQKIINFLKKYIKELEISLKNTIYKIYFPMLNKANTIEEYKEEYYKVEGIDSSDFINYLLSNYDAIHIRAKEYVLINKIINLPILNVFFKNIDILGQILIIFSLITNLIIMLSYNNFNTTCDDEDELGIKIKRRGDYVRLNCPYLLYKKTYDSSLVLNLLRIFGIVELILQIILFVDYVVRIFSVEQAKIKLKYRIKNLREAKEYKKQKNYILLIVLEIIYKFIFNFRSLYYILSILFVCFGLAIHPFFYCITLLEFVNRIQLMQTVLKAMYKPLGSILITLLMFLILEYLFSLFAVSYFTYDYPSITDTKNYLKTFLRSIDQTFKQDGGVGTYLDKTLDPDYTDYTVSAYFNIKFFYDLLFYLLIISLILELFLSTIIDYFNETRENNENFESGLEENCTVCGMEREDIEKIYSNNKNAFEKHVTYFHNAFNYIYYLMYLQSSSFKDSVIEKGVWNLHLNKKLSYLPKNTCFKIYEKKCWKKLDEKKKQINEEDK